MQKLLSIKAMNKNKTKKSPGKSFQTYLPD